MLAIFKKEIRSFFSSLIGYLVIGLFLLVTGLFLWVFKGGFNMFDYGFADLSPFFLLTPWVFLFLVPALTMKSFSEEKSMGTIELLMIKPLSGLQLVLGKFFGVFVLCVIAIVPTLIYVFAIANLGTTVGNYDSGVILGSYFGLLFLMAAYVAIGIFASSLSKSQIMAFILAVFFSFILFYGFEALAGLFSDGALQRKIMSWGAKYHFENIARGVLETKDLLYFLSLTLFFLMLTQINLKSQKR